MEMTENNIKLEVGRLYYVKKLNGDIVIREACIYSTLRTEKAIPFVDFEDRDIIEVIAPIPAYEQIQDTQKKIEIAVKALNTIKHAIEFGFPKREGMKIDTPHTMLLRSVEEKAQQALKEIKK
jgi:hypothetical protein